MSTALPRWDVSAYFPSLDSREFSSAHEGFAAEIDRLGALYDEHGVRGGDPCPVDDEVVTALDAVIDATNRVLASNRLLSAYVSAFTSTDARDERAAGIARHSYRRPAPGCAPS